MVSLAQSFRPHYGPEVDSASNRNEYQEYFLRDKGGLCVGLTILLSSCAIASKSGSLNLLEPSGPVQACNGIAFYISLCCRYLQSPSSSWTKCTLKMEVRNSSETSVTTQNSIRCSIPRDLTCKDNNICVTNNIFTVSLNECVIEITLLYEFLYS